MQSMLGLQITRLLVLGLYPGGCSLDRPLTGVSCVVNA